MNTNTREYKPEDAIAEAVIGAAYEVSNALGAGFLEKVYERALARELALRGLDVKSQVRTQSRTRDSASANISPIYWSKTNCLSN